jgi:ligand-binding sensor domain-containing protein
MWIGTGAGLCRYDGISMRVYDEKDGLKFLEVWSIAEDENHHLWLSTYPNGIAEFDGKNFTQYKTNDKEWEYNAVRKLIYLKKHKCLVLATENGLALFDKKKYIFLKRDRYFQITGIDTFKNDIYFTASFKGMYRLKISKQLSKSRIDSINYEQLSFSSFIKNGFYYSCGPNHVLFKRNLKTQKITNRWNIPIVWGYADDSQNIYLAAWNIAEPKGGVYKLTKNQQLKRLNEVPSNAIWSVYLDKERNRLWVGSMDKGVYIVDLSNKIEFTQASSLGLKSLEPEEIFTDDNGVCWIGAKNNLIIKTNRDFEVISKEILYQKIAAFVRKEHPTKSIESFISQEKKLGGFRTYNIHTDKNSNYWVNTSWGLICFDKQKNIKAFNPSNGGHSFIDSKNQLFVSKTFGTMYQFKNIDSLNSDIYKKLDLKNRNIPRDVIKIVTTPTETWLASEFFGVYKFKDGKFESLAESKIFDQLYIKDLVLIHKNQLLIGTKSGNVFKIATENNGFKILKKFRVGKEIIGSTINFLEAKNDYLFIGTNRGINVLKNGIFIKLIGVEEGLKEIFFNDATIHANKLYISSLNGIHSLSIPEIVNTPKYTSKLIVNDIEVNGKKWSFKKGNSFYFEHNQNNIKFDVKSLNLYNANKNSYQYQITELHPFWTDYAQNETFQLNGLAPGSYHIKIKGKNLGTGNVIEPLFLTIHINPPFWKTLWFYVITLLAVSSLIYFFVTYRIKRIRQFEREKSNLRNQLAETKLEALRSQMNPHFIFNAMNSIQNFIIDNDAKNAMYYLSEFSRLIRHTLENSTEKFTTIELELKFLHNYLNVQKMRFNDITTTIQISEEIDIYSELIPPLVIQPFIENAFEHAFEESNQKKQINILFFIESGLLFCKISDNGIGITNAVKNKLHKSISGDIVSKRFNLLNTDLQTSDFGLNICNDFDNSGTIVLISFKRIKLNDTINFEHSSKLQN